VLEYSFAGLPWAEIYYKLKLIFYEIRMGKFCHCRFMDIVHNSYNVGQVGQSEQFLYFSGIDDGGGFLHRL